MLSCPICVHSKRLRIEAAIGNLSDAKIAKEFGLKVNSVMWHRRNHAVVQRLPAKVEEATILRTAADIQERQWIQFQLDVQDELRTPGRYAPHTPEYKVAQIMLNAGDVPMSEAFELACSQLGI